ncbi:MAG: MoaD/ThiS family protein [Coriobacteriia bacterium]|nr:MoaD/ThiS family protein [Coriobacteriia bacterium]
MATMEIRLFGLLHADRVQRGLPSAVHVEIPEEGIVARDLAHSLELPLDLIEGVFCNGKVCGPSHVLMPGDRVAFVPKGTPGPHRFALGLYSAGAKEPWDR